jgi:hypothetical protein
MHQVACPDINKNPYAPHNTNHDYYSAKPVKNDTPFKIRDSRNNDRGRAELPLNTSAKKNISELKKIEVSESYENSTIELPQNAYHSELSIASHNEYSTKEIIANPVYPENTITREVILLEKESITLSDKNSSASSGSSDGDGIGFSIASLVLGILAFLNYPAAALVLAILAIVFGGISLKKHYRGRGMAIAGLVLGIVAIVLILL